ncbi:hypothetical protein GT042_02815, partial [Streptomyces sp. SID3212]|nr:hypothetical protein [Streptomyces sp. SID3212]
MGRGPSGTEQGAAATGRGSSATGRRRSATGPGRCVTGRRRFMAGDRGSVTVEAAMAVPALVAFTLALVWALTAASAQIRCVDAARAGARAAARSEPEAEA